jgi:hypothetical protein
MFEHWPIDSLKFVCDLMLGYWNFIRVVHIRNSGIDLTIMKTQLTTSDHHSTP